jgi:hypothetical protein
MTLNIDDIEIVESISGTKFDKINAVLPRCAADDSL